MIRINATINTSLNKYFGEHSSLDFSSVSDNVLGMLSSLKQIYKVPASEAKRDVVVAIKDYINNIRLAEIAEQLASIKSDNPLYIFNKSDRSEVKALKMERAILNSDLKALEEVNDEFFNLPFCKTTQVELLKKLGFKKVKNVNLETAKAQEEYSYVGGERELYANARAIANEALQWKLDNFKNFQQSNEVVKKYRNVASVNFLINKVNATIKHRKRVYDATFDIHKVKANRK